MIPQHPINPAQLPLPFQPDPIAQLTKEDREAVLMVLAQLFLAAAGIQQEETKNER